MTSQIIAVSIVYTAVCLGANRRKHQSSASLAFVGEFTGDQWIPAQRASNAENVSIRWRHHRLVTDRPLTKIQQENKQERPTAVADLTKTGIKRADIEHVKMHQFSNNYVFISDVKMKHHYNRFDDIVL